MLGRSDSAPVSSLLVEVLMSHGMAMRKPEMKQQMSPNCATQAVTTPVHSAWPLPSGTKTAC